MRPDWGLGPNPKSTRIHAYMCMRVRARAHTHTHVINDIFFFKKYIKGKYVLNKIAAKVLQRKSLLIWLLKLQADRDFK